MLKKIVLLVFIPCLAVFSVFFWNIPCEAGWFKTYGGTGNDSASSSSRPRMGDTSWQVTPLLSVQAIVISGC